MENIAIRANHGCSERHGFQYKMERRLPKNMHGESSLSTTQQISTRQKYNSRQNSSHLLFTILATILFSVTAWFSGSSFASNATHEANHILQTHVHISFSSTIALLRLLQGLTSVCTAMAVSRSFEVILWTLACSSRGLRILSILSLSPTTGYFGTFMLICTKRAQKLDRLWSALR